MHDDTSESNETFQLKILISTELIGGLIGHGGSTVRQLRKESSCQIHISDKTANESVRTVLFTGTLSKVIAAFSLVLHQIVQ